MRPFRIASGTVTWPDGSSTAKAAVHITAEGHMSVQVGPQMIERTVTQYERNGQRLRVYTTEGVVLVRRDGGCSCRG